MQFFGRSRDGHDAPPTARCDKSRPTGLQRSVGALRKVGTNRPPDPWWDFPHLSVIVNDTDDEATVKAKQEKVVAEHVARHPEDAGRTVKDFF